VDESRTIQSGYFKGNRDTQFVKIKSNQLYPKVTKRQPKEIALIFQCPNSETRRGRVGKGVAQTLDTGCQSRGNKLISK
jgi:hypothetical protein